MRFLDFLLDTTDISKIEPPPLRKGESLDDRERIDMILKDNWDGFNAWKITSNDNNNANEQGRQFTYGEVTSNGVRQLIQLMGLEEQQQLAGDSKEEREPVIFYDLGSGAGKLVTQLFLEDVVVTASIGVELSQVRHSIAINGWRNVRESLGLTTEDVTYSVLQDDEYVAHSRVGFLNQDALETDFSDATHLFLSSLCFPTEVTESLSKVIMDNFLQFGKLKAVAALTDLPVLETPEHRKYFKKTFELISMTWGLSTVKVYTFLP